MELQKSLYHERCETEVIKSKTCKISVYKVSQLNPINAESRDISIFSTWNGNYSQYFYWFLLIQLIWRFHS